MAATANWFEQNGTATGNPAAGVETPISTIEWKNIDNATTPRASAPVLAGTNSYAKYNYLKFSGSFNQISAVKFAHTSGSLGTGIALKSKITSNYETPSTASLPGATDITNPTTIGSGASVLLSTTGPNGTVASASQTTACSTQYLATQVQASGAANAGDSGTVTLVVQYNEN